MHKYVITLLAASLVGICFCVLLSHFSVVLACYNAQYGSALRMYGTSLQGKQLTCIQMISQRIIFTNQNYWFICCDKLGEKLCFQFNSNTLLARFSEDPNDPDK